MLEEYAIDAENGRTLTGAWIETVYGSSVTLVIQVAPSRVRGLKLKLRHLLALVLLSHPHGCVD